MDAERIIQLLLERGLADFNELNILKEKALTDNSDFTQLVIAEGLITKDALYEALAEESGIPYVDLEQYDFDASLIEMISGDMAREYGLFPLFRIRDVLTVAMADPSNLIALDQVASHTNLMVEGCLTAAGDITAMIDLHYGRGPSEAEQLIAEMGEASKGGGSALAAMEEMSGESPITKLVNLIMSQGVRDEASDIHIEPEEDILRIRFRIDGILHEIPSPPKNLELAIISRIKVLSNLDIAETRAPQDGHFQIGVDGRRVDVRVSTLPTVYGENVVMRLLDTSNVRIGLEEMGFGDEVLKRYEELIQRPYGVILSTGPTGSGKTTTLYSALTRINSIDRNIITVEDPVEYRIGLIRQVPVNPRAGITFANGLRSILRQDPDVIMVGEIRDLETAIIAVQAALTGHLVFSTLHTNDAASAIARLHNMGVEPFLISAALTGIMAQRLVRKICPDCRQAYEPSRAMIDRLGLKTSRGKVQLYKGAGCPRCKGTGYKGRTGLFELMVISDEMRELIMQNLSTIAVRDFAQKEGMLLLRDDGIDKAFAGLTTIEEVSRVTDARTDTRASKEPVPVEIKPMMPSVDETPAQPVSPVMQKRTVSENELEAYRQKMASWLAQK